ncbi:CLUMA_CG012784, isoform A [Clunio marinus]|uniref:CLUMA_CG012784, isoform A n=1 Tax=Clunio marinus TaxID=568069 RepID=A0A1J1II31_9DIPT|nr:CLUMA_CG012784, isoform A [Clunio marinus]
MFCAMFSKKEQMMMNNTWNCILHINNSIVGERFTEGLDSFKCFFLNGAYTDQFLMNYSLMDFPNTLESEREKRMKNSLNRSKGHGIT